MPWSVRAAIAPVSSPNEMPAACAVGATSPSFWESSAAVVLPAAIATKSWSLACFAVSPSAEYVLTALVRMSTPAARSVLPPTAN